MTNKKSSKKSSKKQTRIGTLVVTLLIVGAYWWLTGSLPGSESTPANEAPANEVVVNAPANEEAATEAPTAVVVEAEEIATAEATGEVVEEGVAAAPAIDQAEEPPTATAIPTEPPPTAVPATDTPEPAPTATTSPKPTATPTNPPRAGPPGIPAVNYDELPREALETIILIAEGGPFPFDRDGITFQNREGILPSKPRGYYSEYTVITPGERTRGARRIIAGEEDELYYTDDHYDSFSWVVLP